MTLNVKILNPDIYDPDYIWVETIPCPKCKKQDRFPLLGADIERYNNGMHVQYAFPDLDVDTREQIKTGYHGKCFDEIFGSDKDVDDDGIEDDQVVQYMPRDTFLAYLKDYDKK